MDKKRDSAFASSLRAERGRLDLSQGELARDIGVSVYSVQNWEDGATTPTLSTAMRIADRLGVSLDKLAGRD